MNYVLDLMSDQSERVPYNHPTMPLYVRKGQLSSFLNYASPIHWHDDVEFSVITAGQMSYNINGKKYVLKQGDGIFINSRQFHNNFSDDGTDCEYICLVFHPLLLSANQNLEKNCIFPVISNPAFSYSILHKNKSWKAELLADIQRVYRLHTEKEKGVDLLLQSILYQIWSILYIHMPDTDELLSQMNSRLLALQDMVGFIQKHYAEKITLPQIALAGNVCQSNCCTIFNDYLHQTPIQYLISYRLNKSVDLLKNSFMNITEISLSCGFNGVSYYTETFKKHFGYSPSKYRQLF